MQDLITMRATESSNFSVHKLISFLNKNLSEAFVEGGGHHLAGAIRFVPNKQGEVLEKIREFVKAL